MTGEAVRHAVTRIRRETRRRSIEVAATTWLGARMLRIDFQSPELVGFESGAPDDHVKLFVPTGEGEVEMRDYTPRRFDPEAGTLTIDFVIHDAGPATQWALAAAIGDRIQIGGPRGSTLVADDFAWYFLVGDETAIPSIARRLETLRPGVPVTALLAVDAPEGWGSLPERDGLTTILCARSPSPESDVATLAGEIDRHWPSAGEGYVWIAAEAALARGLRNRVVDQLGHPRPWTRAAGYWSKNLAGAHESIGD